MDQRPGQNVDFGLYFHMEGPVSPKNKAKKSICGRTNPKISKQIFRAQPRILPSKQACAMPSEGQLHPLSVRMGAQGRTLASLQPPRHKVFRCAQRFILSYVCPWWNTSEPHSWSIENLQRSRKFAEVINIRQRENYTSRDMLQSHSSLQ